MLDSRKAPVQVKIGDNRWVKRQVAGPEVHAKVQSDLSSTGERSVTLSLLSMATPNAPVSLVCASRVRRGNAKQTVELTSRRETADLIMSATTRRGSSGTLVRRRLLQIGRVQCQRIGGWIEGKVEQVIDANLQVHIAGRELNDRKLPKPILNGAWSFAAAARET